MLRALIFDFNGVLVDDEPLHLELTRQVLAEESVALDETAYLESYLGLDDRSCLAAAMRAAGEDPDEMRLVRLVARKASYYQERIRRDGFPFFAGAVETVAAAHEAGLTLGLVSGALRGEIEAALRQEGILELFKTVVSAEDAGESKPSPAGYLRALQALNSLPPLPERLFHPHEVLAIEDTPLGIEAAAAAGLVTLGVAHTYAAEALSAADRVVGRLAEVDPRSLAASFQEATRA